MYDVIIIGSGPAGLTAAIYTTRANFKTLVIAGEKWGGQLMLTTLVENYPGFPEGIQGPDLMTAMRKQAEHHGAEFVDENATEGDFTKGGGPFKVKAGDKEYESKSIIIATGADTRWLDVPGEKEKIGRGVSTCAPCDAPFFRDKNVIVVGGGDSAMEEANVLTNFAKTVTIVHRRDEFRASKIMIDKAKKNPKIKFLMNARVLEILGDQKVSGIKLFNNKTKETTEMPIDGVFVAIGHWPNSNVFKDIDKDERGYIKVYDNSKTNIEGVFVAGDVQDSKYQQAVTAAGFGCQAALDVEDWLRSQSK
ncbi:MAG: thioredoxin-disulfide reductase [Candidatus Levybacteria bacterium]|nr:thioredoxin-disulfide reductase [Candidatus Levybacteria bacterium]